MPLKNGRTSVALQQILVGSVTPPGTIQAFGGVDVPAGWLLCDGSIVSRSTYSALFDAIGTANGEGDSSTTFHLPDLRGRFLRGADNMGTGAAGRDPDAAGRTAANTGGATGNAVGSVQGDAIQGHWHQVFSNAAGSGAGSTNPRNTGVYDRTSTSHQVRNPISNGVNGTPRTSSESRPQNLTVEYIIKV